MNCFIMYICLFLTVNLQIRLGFILVSVEIRSGLSSTVGYLLLGLAILLRPLGRPRLV